ncbi:hypothetical protein ACEPAF_5924 [Sanghuangporus sanghuang]
MSSSLELQVSPSANAGGYTAESALKDAEELGDLIVFGRYYISNVSRKTQLTAIDTNVTSMPFIALSGPASKSQEEIPFTPCDRSKFYVPESLEGYVDYPSADPEAEAFYNAKKKERERNYTPT